jgi:hypothetical protein
VIRLQSSSEVILDTFEIRIQTNEAIPNIGIGDNAVTMCLINSNLIDRSSLSLSCSNKHSIEMKLDETFDAT